MWINLEGETQVESLQVNEGDGWKSACAPGLRWQSTDPLESERFAKVKDNFDTTLFLFDFIIGINFLECTLGNATEIVLCILVMKNCFIPASTIRGIRFPDFFLNTWQWKISWSFRSRRIDEVFGLDLKLGNFEEGPRPARRVGIDPSGSIWKWSITRKKDVRGHPSESAFTLFN